MFGQVPCTRNQQQLRANYNPVGLYNIFDGLANDSFLNASNFLINTFRVDVKEEADTYLVEAEMPGIKREDIKLDYKDSRLIISVEQKAEETQEDTNYIHRERRFASTKRVVYLKNIDATKIDAKLEDGVLKIYAPKLESAMDQLEIEVK